MEKTNMKSKVYKNLINDGFGMGIEYNITNQKGSIFR